MNKVPFCIPFEFNGKRFLCEVIPLRRQPGQVPRTFQVTLNEVYFGIVSFTGNSWVSDTSKKLLVERIGNLIHECYSAEEVAVVH